MTDIDLSIFFAAAHNGDIFVLKKFLDKGFKIKEKFNYKEYIENTLKKIYEIIDKGW